MQHEDKVVLPLYQQCFFSFLHRVVFTIIISLPFCHISQHCYVVDINECLINRYACSIDEDCVNTPGSYRCELADDGSLLVCGTGFQLNSNQDGCEGKF